MINKRYLMQETKCAYQSKCNLTKVFNLRHQTLFDITIELALKQRFEKSLEINNLTRQMLHTTRHRTVEPSRLGLETNYGLVSSAVIMERGKRSLNRKDFLIVSNDLKSRLFSLFFVKQSPVT